MTFALLSNRLYQYRHPVMDLMGRMNNSARFPLLDDGKNQVYKTMGFWVWEVGSASGNGIQWLPAMLYGYSECAALEGDLGAGVTLSLVGYDTLNTLLASYQQETMG